MRLRNIIIMCVVTIVAAIVIVRFVVPFQENNTTDTNQQSLNTLSAQTSEGNVTVIATPKTLNPGSQAVFNVEFNTHSVELTYDISKIAQLTDDVGNSYQPLSWTGGKGGHHIEGELTFAKVLKSAKKVTLTIPNIDNQNREFVWKLK